MNASSILVMHITYATVLAVYYITKEYTNGFETAINKRVVTHVEVNTIEPC